MALPKNETFTGANGTPLSTYDANWALVCGGLVINSNNLANAGGTGSTENCHRWVGDSFAATHYASATYVDAAARMMGLAVCIQAGAANYYAWYGQNKSYGNRREFVEVAAGAVSATHYSDTTNLTVGQTLYLEEGSGNVKTFKVNGVTISTVTDSTYSGGSAGPAGRGSGDFGRIDDLEVGDLGGGAATGPVGARMVFAMGRGRLVFGAGQVH